MLKLLNDKTIISGMLICLMGLFVTSNVFWKQITICNFIDCL